jgi:hypothetical protein
MRTGTNARFQGMRTDTLQPLADWQQDHIPTTAGKMRGDVSGEWRTMSTNMNNRFEDARTDSFRPLSTWMETHLPTATRRGVERIGTAFNRIRVLTHSPVDWVIQNVFNGGLVPMWNRIAEQTDLKAISRLGSLKGLARGGLLPGQSSYRDGDSVLVPMRPGEGVYVSEAMRDPYERARLFAVNRAAMQGRDLAQFRDGFAMGGIRPDMSTHDYAALAGEGFYKGGIFGRVNDFVKKPWGDVVGNLSSWAYNVFEPISRATSGTRC